MVYAIGKDVRRDAYKALGLAELSEDADGEVTALNTLPWARKEFIDIPGGGVMTTEGTGLLAQTKSFNVSTAPVSVEEVGQGIFILQNSNFRVEVQCGVIKSLFDLKASREVIAAGGKANQIVIFDDKPLYWQAWDVEVFHLESRKELAGGTTEITERSAHRVSVTTKCQISDKSWIKTTISLSAAIDNEPTPLTVQAEVEWQETMKFLKVEFPVAIWNTEASYETQYGIIRRPTHYNTT